MYGLCFVCLVSPYSSSNIVLSPRYTAPPHGRTAPLQAPWDPSKFNFYKAGPIEFMLSYTPSFRQIRQVAAAKATTRGDPENGEPVVLSPGVRGQDSPVTRATRQGFVKAMRYFPSVGCGEVSDAAPPRDAVLVNVKPVGPVSVLLTPG